MKVNESIKNTDNFIINKNGEILAIKNDSDDDLHIGGNCTKEKLLNAKVKETNILKGMFADYKIIRLEG